MSGFAQALEEDFNEQLRGEAKTYLDQISFASRKMSVLIDGILSLSRSTRGEMRRDPVDLGEIASRLLQQLAQTESGRQMVVEMAGGLLARGDARMMEAALANLLGNAWKNTARTAAARIRVYAEMRGNERWFCVADNGAGFDMAHAERLFKPFQRLHRQEEFPASASAWPPCSASSSATAAESRRAASRARAQYSASLCLNRSPRKRIKHDHKNHTAGRRQPPG